MTTNIYKNYQAFFHMEKIPLSLLQAEQSQVSQAFLVYVL